MSSKPGWRHFVPRYEVPPLPPMTSIEKVALLVGTGLGSGFFKPFAPTWGSVPGFLYFILVSSLPLPAAIALLAALQPPAIWSGTICERLLGKKDPRPVVIDEIAAVPFALWPLWLHWPAHWISWIVLFVTYRIADFLKPWPADNLQSIKGGLGILIDDIISSAYMGFLLFIYLHYFPTLI